MIRKDIELMIIMAIPCLSYDLSMKQQPVLELLKPSRRVHVSLVRVIPEILAPLLHFVECELM